MRIWAPEVAVGTVALALLTAPGAGSPVRGVVLLAAVMTLVVLWRVPRRWPGVAMLVWGLLGVALGIAVGLRHTLAGEIGPSAIAACVALVAGLYLVAAGSRRLLRGLRWPVRLAGIAGLAVTIVVGLYLLVIPLLATQPLRGAAPDRPPGGFSDVTFPASDGVTLSGWYTAGRNGAAVVVVPGAGSSRTGAVAQAEVLADAGYAVLVYDPRGHGASGGRAMDLGWAGDTDMRGAVDYLTDRAGVGTVGALGLSMGGEQALGAAAGDPRIAAVVAEGATNRVASDLRWLSTQYGVRGTLQVGLEYAKQAITAGLTPYRAPVSLRAAIAAITPRPVLLIVAGERPDEQQAAEYNASPTTRVWVVPGADHTAGLSTAPAEWTEEVLGFFDQALE